MKLTYRGVTYKYSPVNQNSEDTEISGRYRGQSWRRCNATHIKVEKNAANLKYRGIAYYIGDTDEMQHFVEQKPRFRVVKREKVENKLAQTHLSNMRRNLERRLQVAKERGDMKLVHLLEDEARQIAC